VTYLIVKFDLLNESLREIPALTLIINLLDSLTHIIKVTRLCWVLLAFITTQSPTT
jgi:hypothetical protein